MSDPADEWPGHRTDSLDDALAFRINRSNRLLLTHLARVLDTRGRGLTPEKWFVLARLREHDVMRQSDLVERALEDAPNVSRLVDSLVDGELVHREVDPTDRRNRILRLTSAGRDVADRMHERAVVERGHVFAGFSAAELDVLTDLLDRLDRNVRARLD